jgi:predicted DsbA family dithiol-disulfide isomerase
MALIGVTTFTDPACPRWWAAQPAMVRVLSEFDTRVRVTYVAAGLAREIPR